jgi:hypothetical protein
MSSSLVFLRRFVVYAASLARVVRPAEIHWRPLGDDLSRVDLSDGVVIDDAMARLHGLGDARNPIKFAHVVRQIRVFGDALSVALEQREIGDIEGCNPVPKYLAEQAASATVITD